MINGSVDRLQDLNQLKKKSYALRRNEGNNLPSRYIHSRILVYSEINFKLYFVI